MLRRSSATVFGLAVAFGLGYMVSWNPTAAPAQAQPLKGKCIGIKAVLLLTDNDIKVYRAFEDGTVERAIDHGTNNIVTWVPVK
jgi:hypothetical protein